MRNPFLAICTLPTFLIGGGCALPQTQHTIGWHFDVGTPATMSVPATVEQTSGPIQVNGLAAMAANAQLRTAYIAGAQAECGPGVSGGAPVTAQLAPRGSCTLDDVCERLGRIEMRLNRPAAEAMAMPKGQP